MDGSARIRFEEEDRQVASIVPAKLLTVQAFRAILTPVLATAVLVAAGCAGTGGIGVSKSRGAELDLMRLAQREAARSPGPMRTTPVPPGVSDDALSSRAVADVSARLSAAEALRHNALSIPATLRALPRETEPVDDQARDQALWHYVKGRDAALRGRDLVAITELEKAHKLDPASPVVIRQLARSYAEMGNLTRAAGYFDQLLELEPSDSEALFALGLAATNRRDFRRAVDFLAGPRLAGATFDHDPAADCLADYMLASAVRELGYDRAWIELATASIVKLAGLSAPTAYRFRFDSLYRQRAEIWRGIGDAHCRLGEFEEALAAYGLSARLPTTDPRALPPRVIYANLVLRRPWSAQLALLAAIDDEGGVTEQDVRLCQYLAGQVPNLGLLADALVQEHQLRPDDATLVRAAATMLPQQDAALLLRSFLHRRPADLDVLGQLLGWFVDRDERSAVALTVALAEDHPRLAAAYGDELAVVGVSPQSLIDTTRTLPASPARSIVLCRLFVYIGALGPAWAQCAGDLERWPLDRGLRLQQIDLAARLAEPQLLTAVLEGLSDLDDGPTWLARSRAHRILGDTEDALGAAVRAVALEPGNGETHLELSMAHVSHAEQIQSLDGRRQHALDAARAAQHALDLDPTLDDAYAILLGLHAPNAILADRAQLIAVRGRLVRENPDSALAAQLDAPEDVAQGRWEQGLKRLLVVSENDPADRITLKLAIAVWMQARAAADAIEYLERRLAQRPADPVLLEQWVGVLQTQEAGYGDEVVLRIESLLRREPSHDAARQLLEVLERRNGRIDRAVELAEARLRTRPQGMRRELEFAALYADAGRDVEAMARLQWILDRGSVARFNQLVSAMGVAGRMSDRDDQFNDLVLSFAQCTVDRFPEAPLQVYSTGLRALVRAGVTDERFDDLADRAVLFARGAAGSTLQEVVIWRQLAQSLVDAGYPAAAGRAVRKRLLADAPLDVPARTSLAVIALVADAAAADAVAAVSLIEALGLRGWLPQFPGLGAESTMADVFYEASRFFNMLGDELGAERLLLETVQRRPDHAMALNNLGYTRLERGRIDEQTVDFIERAYRLVPDDGNVLDTVGWLRYKNGHFDDDGKTLGAVGLVNRSILVSGEPSAEVLDHLGDIRWRLGDAVEARDAWQGAADLLQDTERREILKQYFLLLQIRDWGLLVAKPEQMYDQQHEGMLDRLLKKIGQADAGGDPAVARTIQEMAETRSIGEANDGGA
ncbi:MAG: tetratricopeptide repeat protein [Planctomycetota bacterium]|nr:MAG: tetratricopeptide repeat protein [Planctomycetota bacterium]